MKIKVVKYTALLTFVLVTLVFNGCMTKFDHIAFNQAASLRVESLMLMDKAVESYSQFENDIDALMGKVEQAYEYALSKPKNEISAKQWEILKNPKQNLLGGFMKRWKEKNRLGPVYIEESKKVIADAFDTIIDLEKEKRK